MQRIFPGRRGRPAALVLVAALAVGALPAQASDQPAISELRDRLAGPLVELIQRPAARPQQPGAETVRIDVEVFPLPGEYGRVFAGLAPGANPVAVGEMIGAALTPGEIESLGRNGRVAWVRPAARPYVESVTGQEVGLIGADDWQAAGITGGGVKVAVIDPSFGGYTARQNSGDLPRRLRTRNYCDAGLTAQGSHGTAVAEIAHEVAPDALLYLICIDTLSDLATATDWAVAEGIDVIVHSVAWFPPGRGDGSGPTEAIIQSARDGGILWVNSAGNYADTHWMGSFTDVDADQLNEFATGDETLRITLPAGAEVTIYLRWDDWDGAPSTDFDLYLYNGAIEVASSTEPQTGAQPPDEEVTYFNGTALPQSIDVVISKFSGDPSPILDLFVLGSETPIEYREAAGSINDPATSPLVLAVGAVWRGDGVIEPFSSQGPTIDGRIKPDLVTPDGVTSGTYGTFYGTSAAAPGAGGAAALVRQSETCPSAADLFSAVIDHTTDTGPVVGPDNTYGAGWLVLGTPPSDPNPVVRYSGSNRYATAAAVSRADFACGARTVFVAVGSDFPDALAGAAAAGRTGAPILLVRPNDVPTETAAELSRLKPDTVVILGGTAVVSSAVESDLTAFGTVIRLSGDNRYSTSAAVSQYAFPDGARTVVITAGESFADALAGGPAATRLGAPVLLTRGTSLPSEVAVEISRLAPTRIYVIGGPVVVSGEVVAQLDAIAPTTRLSGINRYETAVAVSQTVFASGAVRVYTAVGTDFPDALAGGAAAGFYGGPVLLVHRDQLIGVVADEITRLGALTGIVLGGTAAISDPVEGDLEALIP